MHVTIALPDSIESSAVLLQCCHSRLQEGISKSCRFGIVFLPVLLPTSRSVWTELSPRFFRSKRFIAQQSARCMLQHLLGRDFVERLHSSREKLKLRPQNNEQRLRGSKRSVLPNGSRDAVEQNRTSSAEKVLRLCNRRRLRLAPSPSRRVVGENEISLLEVVIVLLPPFVNRLESTWCGYLIRWEHCMIRAQSLAGFYSTLGGGYFMCHHFKTAVALAQQQQRMAAILNDQEMFYKCLINQAYNFIYAGKFRAANRLIDLVLSKIQPSNGRNGTATATSTTTTPDHVLIGMCRSARLFSKRVSKASRKLSSSNSESNVSSTVDDYSRIRVVQDQSTSDDRLVPFGP